MTILELVEFILICAIVVVFLIWFLIKSIKNKWLSSLVNTINESIKEAEENLKLGSEKKKHVLYCVEIKCNELGIPYNLLHGIISKLIDTIIKHYNIISK